MKIRTADAVSLRLSDVRRTVSAESLLFHIGLVLFVIQTYIFHSEYEQYLGASVSKSMRMLCLAIFLLKVLLAERSLPLRLLSTTAAVGAFVMVIQQMAGAGINLLMLIMLLLAARDIPYRSITRTMFWSCLVCMLAVLIGYKEGLFYRVAMLEEVRTREYLGFTYVTFGPIYFLNIVFCGLYTYTGRPREDNEGDPDVQPLVTWILLAVLFVWNYWFFKQTDTKLIFLVGLLFLVLYTAEIKMGISIFRNNRFTRFMAAAIFPALAVLIVGVSSCFRPNYPFWEALDDLSHNRIGLNYQGLTQYGIKPFGQVIVTNTDSLKGDYFYIDSGYVKALLNYGLFMTILILGLYAVMYVAAIRERDVVLCIWFFCLACYAVINNNIISPVENAGVLALWYCLRLRQWTRDKREQQRNSLEQ